MTVAGMSESVTELLQKNAENTFVAFLNLKFNNGIVFIQSMTNTYKIITRPFRQPK